MVYVLLNATAYNGINWSRGSTFSSARDIAGLRAAGGQLVTWSQWLALSATPATQTPTILTTRGLQGIQGVQGLQGVAGLQGVQGSQGSTGPTGPAGSGTIASAEFAFGTASPLVLASIGMGQKLYRGAVLVDVAFNGASPTFSLGTSASPGLVLASLPLGALVQFLSEEAYVFSGSDLLLLTLSLGGSTAGHGYAFFSLA